MITEMYVVRIKKRKIGKLGICQEDEYKNIAVNFLGIEDGIKQDDNDILDYSFRRMKVDNDTMKKIQYI